jgi:hypothetical protein
MYQEFSRLQTKFTFVLASVADPDPSDPYFLGLLNPDPDPSIIKQKFEKNIKLVFVGVFKVNDENSRIRIH